MSCSTTFRKYSFLFFFRKRKETKENSSLFVAQCIPFLKRDLFGDLSSARGGYELPQGAHVAVHFIFSRQKATFLL